MSTPGFTVRARGRDSSGRTIYMTDYAWAVWQAVLADPEVAPFAHLIVIVQGGFMTRNGGGASASAGYHDKAGCWDIRTWNLTLTQQLALVKALRQRGVAAWRREKSYARGGMDPHIHVVLGTDAPLASGALTQWNQYLRGESGLASGSRDYERRPSPLVTKPPKSVFQEDDMADAKTQELLGRLETKLDRLISMLSAFRRAEYDRDAVEAKRNSERYKALVTKLGGVADSVPEARDAILEVLAAESDVTGPDNPAPKEEA